MFSFLSGERKENQKRKPGTRLGWPAAPARRRGLVCSQKYFAGLFFRSLFFPEKEKRTRKESREPAWVGPLRPPVSGTHIPRKNICGAFLSEKPRKGKWVTQAGAAAR